jgi:hypothetical protein
MKSNSQNEASPRLGVLMKISFCLSRWLSLGMEIGLNCQIPLGHHPFSDLVAILMICSDSIQIGS